MAFSKEYYSRNANECGKVAFLCAAFAAVHASGIIGAPLINTGISASSRQQDGTATATGKGSYTITDIDGRARRVDYVADGHGFRATVKTNERNRRQRPGRIPHQQPLRRTHRPGRQPRGPSCPRCRALGSRSPSHYGYWVCHRNPSGYGGIGAIAAPVAYGGVIGHGAALGLGYGAGIFGAGIGRFLVRCPGGCPAPLASWELLSSTQESAPLPDSKTYWATMLHPYTIKDGLGATNSRSEVGDGYGNRKGSYTIADIDGRARRVDYVADGHGFRATVKTNEPGTAASTPAAALVNSPYAGPVAPVVDHVAPCCCCSTHGSLSPSHWLRWHWCGCRRSPSGLRRCHRGMEPPLDWDTEQAFWVPESVKSSDLRTVFA
ncbi:adult-specific rigid cuticular protein 15.7 [Caerostris extrusa]|uniref:Adult-specific rigid cuticular protein 15.7 n=1 Tax=Caerostris extrusa TaxID=172846 RepID=A0AAV4TRG6_CAEEX|nr:adult-specific rigid cuticular protein 15.7 [Caerostris extrusa]